MKKNWKLILVTIMVSLLSSCFEPKLDTPEKLLQHYVYLAFAGSDESKPKCLLSILPII